MEYHAIIVYLRMCDDAGVIPESDNISPNCLNVFVFEIALLWN